jgi:Glutathione S-transferase, C-terminal domain
MIEDLEEVEEPTLKDGFTDTWLTRRRTWDEKGRALRVLSLRFIVDDQLHALASDFYTPLSNLVNSTTAEYPFLFENGEPTSLDALIYGHLSLHLLPTIPDPVLRTTIVEYHPRLAFYLHKCHEFFERRNNETMRVKDSSGWGRLVQGWGVNQGKRIEDLVGIGGFFGVILGYALWRMAKLRYR